MCFGDMSWLWNKTCAIAQNLQKYRFFFKIYSIDLFTNSPAPSSSIRQLSQYLSSSGSLQIS